MPGRRPESAALLRELHADRFLAHQLLFPHRHPAKTPYAHKVMCEAIYQPGPRQLIEGFRGCAKSTWLEETAVVRGCFGEFRNMVIVGSSYERACERLIPIKHELLYNDKLIEIFGRQQGKPWHEGKIVLKSGVCIQALGRDQAMTGIKHGDWRPDAALVDDAEDPEEVRTDENREQSWSWFLKTFLPSLDHLLYSWVRVLGTRRGRGSLPERLQKAGWPTLKLPIEYIGEDGGRLATWPGKFPLEEIDEIKRLYRGDMHTYMQEFMCEAVSESARTFTQPMIRVVPRDRVWEATYAMYDPARSTTRRSATTGKAVWSWQRNRLIVWEGRALKVKPDEMIADIVSCQEEFSPIWIGIEQVGLEEWIMQPLRHESARRGMLVPVKPLRAPRSKLDFIGQLQRYFNAGEVEFAKPLPELTDQLMSFPTGDIDAPNALAYALTMRPGQPIYENFSLEHIAETVLVDRSKPVWLACNATKGLVTMVLVQSWGGRTRVIADAAMEGDPAEIVSLMVRDMAMLSRVAMTAVCGPEHSERFTNVGLVQALKKIPIAVETGGAPAKGREVLRREFGKLVRDEPAVRVSQAAPRVLNGLAGGYAIGFDKRGVLTGEADPGVYKVTMEGIESCLSWMEYAEEVDAGANYAYTRDGRRYLRYGSASRERV